MNIYEKLLAIQTELKCPKNQYNSFGKYAYRSAEDILEAVKPLCSKNKAVLVLSDRIEQVGERYYVRTYATLQDTEDMNCSVTVEGVAREEESKKGMDGCQVTGSASSYARKYALNGLFDIDDTKDNDAINEESEADKYISEEQILKFKELGITETSAISYCKVDSLIKIPREKAQAMIEAKEKSLKKVNA